MRPFRWLVNVQTGERRQIELTDAEIARAEAKRVVEDERAGIRNVMEARRAARQARLDAFLDKIEADPTIIDRIR